MRTTWTFHSAGRVVFGRHAVARLAEVVADLGFKRVVVVTDRVLVRAGLLDPVRDALRAGGAGVDVFDGGEPEPSLKAAEACAAAARPLRPDALVGLGGGSNMDLAKLAAVLLTHGGSLLDHAGEERVPGPALPVVCVPTTSGTGSEVSPGAVFTDTERQIKLSVLGQRLRPVAAVVDPLLTVTCPPKVTADSGIDALTHAIEGYTAVDASAYPDTPGERPVYQGRNPLADGLAHQAIGLVGQYLRRAVRDGGDLEAREGMSLAALLAGLAFTNSGVALVHALEYPVGGAVHVSHGAGNGLLLPYVMRFNLPARPREFAEVARLLGEDVAGLPEPAAAERAVAAVERLRADIGIPHRLRDIGVREEQLRSFAEKAAGIQRLLRVNPRPGTVDELEALLRSAF